MKRRIRLILLIFALLGFTSGSAQIGNCDSLSIMDVQLNPFNTSQILVRSAYNDFDNFISYPGFSFTDENDFILALETVNFFGMSIEQVHVMDIIDLEVIESMPVEGTLELWSFFYDFLECEYEGPFVLWPAQECVPLRLTLNTLNGDSISGNVSVQVFDGANSEVAEHSLDLVQPDTIINWDFCLPAGCGYNLKLNANGIQSSGFSYSVHYSDFLSVGASGIVTNDTLLNNYFNLYNCPITEVGEVSIRVLNIFPNPASNQFTIDTKSKGGQWNTMRVVDCNGREVKRQRLDDSANIISVDCSQWPSGVYSIILIDKMGQVARNRVVVR